jgi:hypothetical protein
MNSHDEFIIFDQATALFYKWGITQPNCTGSDMCKGDRESPDSSQPATDIARRHFMLPPATGFSSATSSHCDCAVTALHCGWGPGGGGRGLNYTGSNTFALHTSPDLNTWTWVTNDVLAGVGYCEAGTAGCLPSPTGGKCGAFLPKILFNPLTRKWLLWWTCRGCSVATAPSPLGPWTVSSFNVTYADGAPVCRGSIEFFVDEPSNEAYLVKNWYNHSAEEVVSIERLDPSWTRSAAASTAVAYNAMTAASSGLIGELGSENAFLLKGPTGLYFLVEPSLCCFCPWGAGASVFTAPTPLGPFTKRTQGESAHPRYPCCPSHAAVQSALALSTYLLSTIGCFTVKT